MPVRQGPQGSKKLSCVLMATSRDSCIGPGVRLRSGLTIGAKLHRRPTDGHHPGRFSRPRAGTGRARDDFVAFVTGQSRLLAPVTCRLNARGDFETPLGQRRKRKNKGLGNWRLVRYCDDFVLMVFGERRHAEALREEVSAVLAPLGLRLAPEKTQVVHIDEGFTFLGFDIRRMRKRGTSKHYVYTKPSTKAVRSIKDKVKEKTYRSTRYQDLGELIADLNRSLAGWANYFRHGVSKATFSAVDSYVWSRLMRWTRAKYAGKTGLSMKELRRRFCDQGWRFAHNGVVFTGAASVEVTRYRYLGRNIPTPWTIKEAAADTGS